MKFLELDKTATNANNAQLVLFLIPTEEHALDQSQHAHAIRNTLLMDTNALSAQPDKLLIQTIIRDVFQEFAMLQVKSSHQKNTAGDVICVHKDMSQTPQEASVLESSHNAHALKSMTLLDMFAFLAQNTKWLLTTIRDVSQDNAHQN